MGSCVLEISFHLAFAYISHISISLKLKRKKWSEKLNAKTISLIESSAEILETAEMKAVESIKFDGVLLLDCIQSKCVHVVLWRKDLTLPDFKGKVLRENCLNIANFLKGLVFFMDGYSWRKDWFLQLLIFGHWVICLSSLSLENIFLSFISA